MFHCQYTRNINQIFEYATHTEMKRSLANVVLALTLCVSLVATLPVTQNKKDEKEKDPSSTPAAADVETALEYERYLREVVEALEADPEFRKKLDKAPDADIRVSLIFPQGYSPFRKWLIR